MKWLVENAGKETVKWAGVFLILFGISFSAHGVQKVALVWDPSPGTNVAGYYLYYGMKSGTYPTRINVRNTTSATVTNLTEGVTYYFVVTAYSFDALESDPSNELAYTVPPASPTATGTVTLANGSVLSVNLANGGFGYTNTPKIHLIGGGGSGAQATAVVSNGTVVAVKVLNVGSGYTNAPLLVITPPILPSPTVKIAPMTLLSIGNLTPGKQYQLQVRQRWYWTNVSSSFTANSARYEQLVAGSSGSDSYRLTPSPAPGQAFATAQLVNGAMVGAKLVAGGSGYATVPTVSIVGGSGSNATAVASVSGGAVTGIIITSAGSGYATAPSIQIEPPPAPALIPTQVALVRLDTTNLSPYENYRLQFRPSLRDTWRHWDAGFSPTAATNSQYCFVTNNIGFFRLEYVP